MIFISLSEDIGIFLKLHCSLKKKYSTVYRSSLSSEFILKRSTASKDDAAFLSLREYQPAFNIG
jgi:hypothetical protein